MRIFIHGEAHAMANGDDIKQDRRTTNKDNVNCIIMFLSI